MNSQTAALASRTIRLAILLIWKNWKPETTTCQAHLPYSICETSA